MIHANKLIEIINNNRDFFLSYVIPVTIATRSVVVLSYEICYLSKFVINQLQL